MSGDELCHVIGEDHSTADPLAVDFAPAELCPAGIGNAHVELVLLYLLPVLCGDDVSQRVGEIVLHHLRVAGGAGSEVDDHGVAYLGGSVAGRACKGFRKCGNFLVEIAPALTALAHDDLVLDAGNGRLRMVNLFDDIVVIYADHGVDLCAVSTVDQVFLCQLQRAGDQDCADLVQCHSAYPVLPAAAQDQHHNSAFPDAKACEVVGCLIGQAGDVGEGEGAVAALIVAPDQSLLFRLLFCPFVHNVKSEVEVGRNVDTVVGFEVLIAVEIDTWQVFVE